MSKLRYCKSCGQLIPPKLPIDSLSPLQQRIYNALSRGQMNSDALFDIAYRNVPDGGPMSGKQSLYVVIRVLNRKLARLGTGIRISRYSLARSSTYRLEQIP